MFYLFKSFYSPLLQKRLAELHSLWDKLLLRLKDKGIKLQQALKLLQFMRQCDEVLYWIRDKEAFVTAEDFGVDLEHVEVCSYFGFVKILFFLILHFLFLCMWKNVFFRFCNANSKSF